MGNKQCSHCKTRGDTVDNFLICIIKSDTIYCRNCYDFKYTPEHICDKLDCISPIESIRVRKIKHFYKNEKKIYGPLYKRKT